MLEKIEMEIDPVRGVSSPSKEIDPIEKFPRFQYPTDPDLVDPPPTKHRRTLFCRPRLPKAIRHIPKHLPLLRNRSRPLLVNSTKSSPSTKNSSMRSNRSHPEKRQPDSRVSVGINDVTELSTQQCDTKLSRSSDGLLFLANKSQAKLPRHERKWRKPKHGDDSVLIGKEICFDPTVQLLEDTEIPMPGLSVHHKAVYRSKLRKLQQVEHYDDFLLGDRTLEEDSDDPSINIYFDVYGDSDDHSVSSQFLGIHLDCFAREEEEEIVFFSEEEDDDVEGEPTWNEGLSNDPEVDQDLFHSLETEIVFSFMEEGDSDEDSSGNSTPISKYSDCRSEFSGQGSIVLYDDPEVLFPLHDDNFLAISPNVDITTDFSFQNSSFGKFDSTLRGLFFASKETGRANVHTPETMMDSLSFGDDGDSLSRISVGDYSEEVLSTGSRPSDAVQSLVNLCRSEVLYNYRR
eukprot:Nitzschia sp. Nitz4//scaffold39_size137210//97886//99262//NITZ4_003213-RA/size137210-processed-gene-0.123-mRNA-1//-1//CDS//3329550425//7574//frame0